MAGVALLVDAANVIGSRPDGWWRDRPGAAARLVTGVTEAIRLGALDDPVVVVLEGAARSGAPAGDGAPRVVHAPRDGDTTIVQEVTALVARGCPVTVVTADRGLRARVEVAGGTVLGPSWLLQRLAPGDAR
jgi:hypothetical protein